MTWNLSEATSQLREVLNRADGGAPQVIIRRDRDYVLLSGEDYRRLVGDVPNFVDYLIDKGPRFDDLSPDI